MHSSTHNKNRTTTPNQSDNAITSIAHQQINLTAPLFQIQTLNTLPYLILISSLSLYTIVNLTVYKLSRTGQSDITRRRGIETQDFPTSLLRLIGRIELGSDVERSMWRMLQGSVFLLIGSLTRSVCGELYE